MAVYQAPDVKDRVAIGDDLYTITDSGGKKKLTPSPTTIEEPGTEINRALLMPLMKAVEGLDANILPYTDYWWRIRQNAGSYVLNILPATQIENAYQSKTDNAGRTTYWVCILECFYRNNGNENDREYKDPRTIKVASSVTMSSSGKVSLVNPTSYNISQDDMNSYSQRETWASRLRGKYVSGLSESPSTIYKIDSSADIDEWSASITVSGENTKYYDYGFEMSAVGSTMVQVVTSRFSATTSDFTYEHSDDENLYPHSGTTNGVEYQFLGKISEFAPKANKFNLQTINVTSASYASNKFSAAVPGNLCFFMLNMITDPYSTSCGNFIGIIDKVSGNVFWVGGNQNSSAYAGCNIAHCDAYLYARGVFSTTTTSLEYIAKYSNGNLLFGSGNDHYIDGNYVGTLYFLPLK
nr:MAG TPA: hypothetical protein [Caudoviricetes sp.]